jgi:hypothetical protein
MNNTQYQGLFAVSASWLKDLLDSPATCYRKHLDPQRPVQDSTASMKLGSLVHVLALTPAQFARECRVMDRNRRTSAGREEWELAFTSGLIPVTHSELEKAQGIVAALKAHPDARKLLKGGRKERTIIQPRLQGLLALKVRLDIHHEARRQVLELKTIYDLQRLQQSMERYHYRLSAAFYADMTKSHSFHFIFVQTVEPYPVAIFELSRQQLLAGRDQWQTALARFDTCWRANNWPEAKPSSEEDDPLMMNFMPPKAVARQRFELPVGELML